MNTMQIMSITLMSKVVFSLNSEKFAITLCMMAPADYAIVWMLPSASNFFQIARKLCSIPSRILTSFCMLTFVDYGIAWTQLKSGHLLLWARQFFTLFWKFCDNFMLDESCKLCNCVNSTYSKWFAPMSKVAFTQSFKWFWEFHACWLL
jgi:hypothetical protein